MQGAQQPECSDLDHNKDKIKSETARIKTNSIDSTQELESQLIPSNWQLPSTLNNQIPNLSVKFRHPQMATPIKFQKADQD